MQRKKMSKLFNYDAPQAAKIYDRERQAVGADIIAGLLHVHSGKQLKDLHVLDPGCGTGHYTKALIDLGVGKFTILDASSAMLSVATEKLKPHIDDKTVADVIEAKLPSLKFADRKFDAAMFFGVFNHLDKSDYVKTIQAAKQILKPHGMVLLTTVLPMIFRDASWLGQLHSTFTERACSRFLTTKQHLSLLNDEGFQCVAAMNLLTKATPPAYINYFDHEGPLKEEWRIGTSEYEIVGNDVIQEIEKKLLDLKQEDDLRQFVNDNDHTDETGFTTIFAFKLAD